MHPLLPSLLPHFPQRDGEMTVGGILVSELAREFKTPLYVYDAATLRARLALLRAAVPQADVYFSVKANPNPAVISVFSKAGAGLEVASAAEYLRARAGGGKPERILFAGPGKGEEELRLVVEKGIGEIHVESREEIALLSKLGGSGGRGPVPVSVRVNPKADVSGGAMRMGGQPAAFGFDEEILDEVVRDICARPGLSFQGIHIFAGTQILDAKVLLAQWGRAMDVARRAAEVAGRPVKTIDLGGGLGVPYFGNESELDLAAVRAGAAEIFKGVSARVILEPGRFLAGPAGVYLARTRTVKESRGKTFVVLDGGMNHHLAASGNLGQVIKRDYPVVNASRLGDDATLSAAVVGPLCTPLDTLARDATLAPVRAGDLVAVLQSGAYGLSASPVGFLSHPMPAEVLVDDGRATLIRPRGTFEKPITELP
ncbi:MAG TPA: alanine racemase [Planctomycetota bacterium]|nr:alanine racemase [Planctomycetota bacterium]